MFESVISYGVTAHLHVHASAVILIAMIVWKSLLVSSSDIGVSGPAYRGNGEVGESTEWKSAQPLKCFDSILFDGDWK